MRFLLVLFGMVGFSSSLKAANPWSPSVLFGGRSVTVSPAKLHLSPTKSKLEIVESEGCEAKLQSSTVIQFGESCQFLRGVYQYSFKQPGSDAVLHLYSEFLIHQNNSKGHVYLINSPIVVPESASANL